MIGIFVKTPGLSPVKTRLARTLGRPLAEAWYEKAAGAVASTAELAGPERVYWAVAEARPDAERHWASLPRLDQGEGSLGRRMARVHGALVERHGAGLLLGADTPQIEPDQIASACIWLDQPGPRRVIGPAEDGGFWLFGANHVLPDECWTAVPYSRDFTLAAFRSVLDAKAPKAMTLTLDHLVDVDTIEDVGAVAKALDQLRRPTYEQRCLSSWMREHPAFANRQAGDESAARRRTHHA